MLGIETKAVRAAWSVLLTIGVVAFLYAARRTILIFLLAIFFAYLLSPVVRLVDRFTPRRLSRTASLGFVYVLLIVVLISAVAAVATRASEEAVNLINRMPELVKSAGKLSQAPLPDWLEFARGKVLDLLKGQVESGVEKAAPILRGAIGQLLSALGNVGFALLVPILSFFFLKDAQEMRAALLNAAGASRRKSFDSFLTDLHIMLGQYTRALFLLSMSVFVIYALFFEIAGVPYAALLATIAALLEFIPVIGPLSAAIIAIVVSAIGGYPHPVWLVVFFTAYRLVQDYAFMPFLMGEGLALHPLLVIFAALAGEQIAGIPGMVFSAPVLAALRLIYVRVRRQTS